MKDMFGLLETLAPLNRTLACEDTDRAFAHLNTFLPEMKITKVKTGSKVWTWQVPKRWELKRATVKAKGITLIDSQWHHLHVVNYSQPFKGLVKREEFLKHLHTNPEVPDGIPFQFSFYDKKWGFCVPHSWLNKFTADEYEVEIDCRFEDGEMWLGHQYIEGKYQETFVVCSDICHPTQANDSISGLVAAAQVAKELSQKKNLKYSYLFLFVPETIGSIAFLAHNKSLIQKCVGGIFTEMLGTNGSYVGTRTRLGNTYWDSLLEQILKPLPHNIVGFLKSASNDEKVLDSPGVDIPTVSFSRYPYPEYHTSKDCLSLINRDCLIEGQKLLAQFIEWAEMDYVPVLEQPGPIFLSGYNLHPDWRSNPELLPMWEGFLDVMYAIDGKKSLLQIANHTGRRFDVVKYWCDAFAEKGLLTQNTFLVKRT
ncbi:MAG: DUF4910 domain-containing protein [Oligoflexia bacterium]|nr:DUF4910 domain-containing protein [Oligoflexia bacterium]